MVFIIIFYSYESETVHLLIYPQLVSTEGVPKEYNNISYT